MYTGNGKYPNNLIPVILPAYTACEDGRECSETSAHKIQRPGNRPKRKNTTFRTGRKFETKKGFNTVFSVLILSFLSKLIRLLVPITLMHYHTTATKHDD